MSTFRFVLLVGLVFGLLAAMLILSTGVGAALATAPLAYVITVGSVMILFAFAMPLFRMRAPLLLGLTLTCGGLFMSVPLTYLWVTGHSGPPQGLPEALMIGVTLLIGGILALWWSRRDAITAKRKG